MVNEKPAAAQLIEEFYRKNAPIIALFEVPDDEVSSCGIIEPRLCNGRVHEVQRFLEKPKPTETTSRLGVIGKYMLTNEIFDYLELVKNKE